MASIRITERIAASPDDAWKIISDVGNISDWFPGIDESSAEGDTRRCSMGEIELVEKIVTLDDELRRLQYSITESPMDIGHHLATVDILDDGGNTLIVYSCDITPDEGAAIMQPALEGGVQALKEKLES